MLCIRFLLAFAVSSLAFPDQPENPSTAGSGVHTGARRALSGSRPSPRPAQLAFGDTYDLAAFWQCGSDCGYLVNTGGGPGPCTGLDYDGNPESCGLNVFTGAGVIVSESERDNGNGTTTVIVEMASADGSDLLPNGTDCAPGDFINVLGFHLGCDIACDESRSPCGSPSGGDELDPNFPDAPYELLEAQAVILGSAGNTLLEFDLNNAGQTVNELGTQFTVSGAGSVTVTAVQFRYVIATGDFTGACCRGDTVCENGLTALECISQGGTYQGDFTVCPGPVCGAPANDTCASALAMSIGTIKFDTTGATLDSGAPPPCDAGMTSDVWFSLSESVCPGGSMDIGIAVGGADIIMEVFTGDDCDSLTSIDCVEGNAPIVNVAAGDYFVRVNGFGSGDITVVCYPPITGGACCLGAYSCADASDAATCLGEGGTYLGDGTICGVNFVVEAASEAVHLQVCDANYDTELWIYDACGGNLLAFNDDCSAGPDGTGADPNAPCFDSDPGSPERASCVCKPTTPGSDYFVRVTGPGETPPPPGANTPLFVYNDALCNAPPCESDADCNDGINCTADRCDPALGCLNTPFDAACDDGRICTRNVCDPQAGGCRFPPQDGLICTDNDLCTANDVCVGGQCEGTPRECDDGIPCTSDACDPATGNCAFSPQHPLCDDQDACTTDTCAPAAPQADVDGCVHAPVDPDDRIECTLDSCDPATGVSNMPQPGVCDLQCRKGICNPDDPDADPFTGCVVITSDVNCDDGVPCTRDLCLPEDSGADANGCIFRPDNGRCEPHENPCIDGVCDPNDPLSDGNGCVHGPVSTSDGVSCTIDLCDPDTGVIVHLPNHALCNDNNPCTADRCEQIDDCVNVPLPNGSTCDDGNPCTYNDQCFDGACVPGTDRDCRDRVDCTVDTCDPNVGCVHTPDSRRCIRGNCESGRCTPGGCLFRPECGACCRPDGACIEVPPDVCGTTIPGTFRGLGTSCRGDADGNGIDDACKACGGNRPPSAADRGAECDDNNACTNDFCGSGGICINEAVICDDNNDCTVETCDPASGCQPVPRAGPCDDGDACTSNDVCISGSCVGQLRECPEDGDLCTQELCDSATGACVTMSISCDDGNACTLDRCSPLTGCYYTFLSCDDDDLCTFDVCDAPTGCSNTPTLECDDGIECTIDQCHPTLGCTHQPDDDLCNDGSACTRDECFPTEGCRFTPDDSLCDDGEFCTDDRCVEESPGVYACSFLFRPRFCDDGDLCTVGDMCSLLTRECEGAPRNCDDGSPCTSDACDVHSGLCINLPTPSCASCCLPDGRCIDSITPVDCVNLLDGFPNSAPTCAQANCMPLGACCVADGQHCAHFPESACGDPDEEFHGIGSVCADVQCQGPPTCGNLVCDPGEDCANCLRDCPCPDGELCFQGQCVECLADANCDDSDVCNGIETCDAGNQCIAGSPLFCDDGIDCTADSCDPAVGCVFTPNAGLCDDGSACTDDRCDPLAGCLRDPVNCDDGDFCTVDACDPTAGCQSILRSCDDAIPCTVDSCDNGACIHRPDHSQCSSGLQCVTDVCNPQTGCQALPASNRPCTDGNPCTVNDTCFNGVCFPGPPLNCADGNLCTLDTCQFAIGCFHSPRLCADLDACTEDFCDPGIGCFTQLLDCPPGMFCYDGNCDCPPTPADLNDDGWVDFFDLAPLEHCLGGPLLQPPVDCSCTDVNMDGVIDLKDVQEVFISAGLSSGSRVRGSPQKRTSRESAFLGQTSGSSLKSR